jgi:hypothetical protein
MQNLETQPAQTPTTNATVQLRPLNVGDILDQTFRILRKHYLLLVGIIAVISVPAAVVQGFGLWQYAQGIQSLSGGLGDAEDVLGAALQSTGPFLITTILAAIASVFQTGALASAISELYLGRVITIGQAYRGVLRRMGPLLLATFLIGLCFLFFGAVLFGATVLSTGQPGMGAAILCLFIPLAFVIFGALFVFSIYWAFMSQAIVLEGYSAVEGLRRSWNLVRGSWWRVFGILLLVGLMVGIASAVPTYAVQFGALLAFPQSIEMQTILSQIVTTVVTILLTPISAIANTLLYYDLRVRKEGFDLELMARQMTAANPPSTEPAPDTLPPAI